MRFYSKEGLMSWITIVTDPKTGTEKEKEFDTEEEAYFYAYKFPRWEVFHS